MLASIFQLPQHCYIVDIIFQRDLKSMESIHSREVSWTKRTVLDSWITGPSAIGSEKGTPSSIMSAPPASIASKMGTVSSLRGNPAVMKVTSAGTPYRIIRIPFLVRNLSTHLCLLGLKYFCECFHGGEVVVVVEEKLSVTRRLKYK